MSAPFPASPRLLVVVECTDGELGDTDKGILSAANRINGLLGGTWEAAVVPGESVAEAGPFAPYGVPEVVLTSDVAGAADSPDLQGKLLARLARERNASLVLLAHTDAGATLAPLLAAELDGALFTEGVSVSRCPEGLELERAALGVQISRRRYWDGRRPLVLTKPVKSLSQVVLPSMTPAQPLITSWKPDTTALSAQTVILERIPPDPQTVDVSEAEVIISAGKGCDPQTFTQVQELARLLNISLGVTRPVYDLGWTGFERMIGQTGRTVAPRLYLALGISGSMHHIGGIKDSRWIVALNSDTKAPIFANADEGFVADLKEVLPRLLERVRQATGGTP
jgi:electron transfer flavoprotein alpha subunit